MKSRKTLRSARMFAVLKAVEDAGYDVIHFFARILNQGVKHGHGEQCEQGC